MVNSRKLGNQKFTYKNKYNPNETKGAVKKNHENRMKYFQLSQKIRSFGYEY